jgi:hypothetical protein
MSYREVARAGALDRKAEMLSKSTWKISDVGGNSPQELMAFLMKHNGDRRQETVPPHLPSLLQKIGNAMESLSA